MNDWKIYQLKGIVDVESMREEPDMSMVGKMIVYDGNEIEKIDEEVGSVDSLTRYRYPKYRDKVYEIKSVIESIIGEKIYPTYYFDRFYFSGTHLRKHVDRCACEVSVSMNISNTTGVAWPISFEYEGKQHDFTGGPGDGVLYKGIEIPHWREELQCPSGYFHQVFFHFVRADGYYLEFAYDKI